MTMTSITQIPRSLDDIERRVYRHIQWWHVVQYHHDTWRLTCLEKLESGQYQVLVGYEKLIDGQPIIRSWEQRQLPSGMSWDSVQKTLKIHTDIANGTSEAKGYGEPTTHDPYGIFEAAEKVQRLRERERAAHELAAELQRRVIK